MKEFLIFMIAGNTILLCIWGVVKRRAKKKEIKYPFDERDCYSENGQEKHKKSA